MTDKERTDLFWEMVKTPKEKLNAMFNSGMFNSIAIAYGKLALKKMGYSEKELEKFEATMQYCFSEYSTEEMRL